MLNYNFIGFFACFYWCFHLLLTVFYSQATPPPPQDYINEFIIRKLNDPLVLLISDSSLIHACIMSCEFTCEADRKFLPAQFPWIWCQCLLKKFNPFKDFQSVQVQRSSRNIFTGTTNGFIFQIMNSSIESCGVRLTCLGCNHFLIVF